MRAGVVAGLAAILLLVPGVARADDSVPESKATEYLELAKDYWERMLPGRRPPCETQIEFLDDGAWGHTVGDGGAAAANVWGCEVLINRTHWHTYSPGSYATRTLCSTVVHEYGHNLGLGHTPYYPVMTLRHTPTECRIAAGETDVETETNPYLGWTQRLYSRGAEFIRIFRHLRDRDIPCRMSAFCYRLVDRFDHIRDVIWTIEQHWPYAQQFRWP